MPRHVSLVDKFCQLPPMNESGNGPGNGDTYYAAFRHGSWVGIGVGNLTGINYTRWALMEGTGSSNLKELLYANE